MAEESTETIQSEEALNLDVDLVIYFAGERLVVGRVDLNPDGSFTAEIFQKIDERAQKVLRLVSGEFKFSLPLPVLVNQAPFTAGELPFDGAIPE